MQSGAGDIFGNNQMMNSGAFSGYPGMGGGGGAKGGSNQWMNYPALPNFNPSGGNTSFGNAYTDALPPAGSFKRGEYYPGYTGGKSDLGGNTFTAPTFDPAFTTQFYQMLTQMMGGGGGNLQNQLLEFLGGGQSNIPGADSLTSMANTGNPISALPEWQKMIEAQQRGIGENAANLKEQFGFMGNLASSPFGNAMSDYFQQTSKDQNALLAQMDTQAMENAMNRELSASQGIMGMAGAESQFLDSLFSGAATASPNLFQKSKTSGLGGILGGVGSMLGGIGSLAGAASSAGGIGALFASLI